MKTCSLAIASIKGLTKPEVAKLNMRPNAMLIGKAGSAFLKMASSSRVKQSPMRMEMKQASVVFQSPESRSEGKIDR